MQGDPEHNILLKNGDDIKIYNKSDMIYIDDVNIEGHVKNPGRKPFYQDIQKLI